MSDKVFYTDEFQDAVKKGDIVTVRKELKQNKDIANSIRASVYGTTPLMDATRNCRSLIVKELLEAGADPNDKTENDNFTALLFAIEGGADVESVTLLLAAGADDTVRLKHLDKETVLELAKSILERKQNMDYKEMDFKIGHFDIMWDLETSIKLLEDAEKGIRPTPEEVGLKLPLKKKSMTDHAKNKQGSGLPSH